MSETPEQNDRAADAPAEDTSASEAKRASEVDEGSSAASATASDADVTSAASLPVAGEKPGGSGGGPQEVLAPKERRQRARTAKAAPARGAVSAEERQAERVALRAAKAVERRGGRAKARASHQAIDREPTPPREHAGGNQKTRQGLVVSDKADKTITVRIDTARRHRKYQKVVRTSRTLHAHDELNDARAGDTVIVRESRPLSRLKRWRLVEVVERAK